MSSPSILSLSLAPACSAVLPRPLFSLAPMTFCLLPLLQLLPEKVADSSAMAGLGFSLFVVFSRGDAHRQKTYIHITHTTHTHTTHTHNSHHHPSPSHSRPTPTHLSRHCKRGVCCPERPQLQRHRARGPPSRRPAPGPARPLDPTRRRRGGIAVSSTHAAPNVHQQRLAWPPRAPRHGRRRLLDDDGGRPQGVPRGAGPPRALLRAHLLRRGRVLANGRWAAPQAARARRGRGRVPPAVSRDSQSERRASAAHCLSAPHAPPPAQPVRGPPDAVLSARHAGRPEARGVLWRAARGRGCAAERQLG